MPPGEMDAALGHSGSGLGIAPALSGGVRRPSANRSSLEGLDGGATSALGRSGSVGGGRAEGGRGAASTQLPGAAAQQQVSWLGWLLGYGTPSATAPPSSGSGAAAAGAGIGGALAGGRAGSLSGGAALGPGPLLASREALPSVFGDAAVAQGAGADGVVSSGSNVVSVRGRRGKQDR